MLRRIIVGVLLLSAITQSSLANTGGEEDQSMSRQKLCSIFLYQFARYIDWPSDKANDSFVIGVYGNSDLISTLEKIAQNKKVKDQQITVKRIDHISEMDQCHILYVANPGSVKFDNMISMAESSNILLVTDHPKGLNKGSVINFVEVNQRLNFEVNMPTADQFGLKISAELIKLANRVAK